jgi:phthiodiolone/phenolphthiodiolone dimycocerosates ketoreductase
MTSPKIAVGLYIPANPPLGLIRAYTLFARLIRLDSVVTEDHFQEFFPTAIWDEELTWLAAQSPTPHEVFDFQTLLGYLASRAGGLRTGVVVTEPTRRHPVLIAQAMLTLAHMTKRPPILGIGAGERENIDPYGLDFSYPVGRLEEALKIIRMCFSSQGPIDFEGEHYRLDGALMDLKAPKGKTPEVWIGGRGPRMLRLSGEYGDGWYPNMVASPQEYASKLEVVRAAARKAGRDPQAITPSLEQYVVVAPTEDEARTMLDTKLIRFFGLLLPPDAWRRAGSEHPFGENFRGFVDFVPERYDRKTLEDAIAQMPTELVTEGPLAWGTPEQVASRLRAFGEVGLRHVVLALISPAISKRAAFYGLRATRTIARLLRGDQ